MERGEIYLPPLHMFPFINPFRMLFRHFGFPSLPINFFPFSFRTKSVH